MIVKYRIKKHSEFQKVIGEGEVSHAKSFTFYVLDNSLGYTRIGISVPKKSGTAVVRNKIKRQIRAIFAGINDYSKSKDLVMIVRKGYDVSNFVQTKNEIQEFISKAR